MSLNKCALNERNSEITAAQRGFPVTSSAPRFGSLTAAARQVHWLPALSRDQRDCQHQLRSDNFYP